MTTKAANKKNPALILMFVALCLISVLAMIKTIFFSFDIDEGYTLAMGYRLAKGDRLFADLWESHQLSAIFVMPFLWLYEQITGSMDGIVIAMRIVGTTGHLCVGLVLILTLRRMLPKAGLVLLLLLHLNYLPKWIQTPEFELLQYWGMLLIFCLLFSDLDQKRGRLKTVLAGILMTCQLLLYPSLILLYPVWMVAIWRLGKGEHPGLTRTVQTIFTGAMLLSGMLLIIYLCSYLSIPDFLRALSELTLDESHTQVPMLIKWKIYLADLMWPLGCAVVCGILCYVIYLIHQNAARFVIPVVAMIISFIQVYSALFCGENQFYFLWRYLVLVLLGIEYYALYIAKRRIIRGPVPEKRPGMIDEKEEAQKQETFRKRMIFWLLILPSLMTLPAILLITNMDVNTTCAKLFPALLGVLILLIADCQKVRFLPLITGMAMVGILCSLVCCKLLLMRVTGCGHLTIAAPMTGMTQGPLQGVLVPDALARLYTTDYEELSPYLSKDTKLLYMGGESIVYLWSDAQIASPSTQGTSAYNQMFVDYYTMYPEKLPDVIVVDREMGENPVYYAAASNEVMMTWIREVYQPSEVIEKTYLTIYRK
ncbi:MAG: hypothetical protein K6G23_08595 [Lachnospiraceae bacterium]|nr:hypothetical protein [Lachnospiraceae bacterium]